MHSKLALLNFCIVPVIRSTRPLCACARAGYMSYLPSQIFPFKIVCEFIHSEVPATTLWMWVKSTGTQYRHNVFAVKSAIL